MCFVDEYRERRDKDTKVRSIAYVPRKDRRRLAELNGIDKVTASL